MLKSNISYPQKHNKEMLVLDVFWTYYVRSTEFLSAEGTTAIPLYSAEHSGKLLEKLDWRSPI